MKRVILSASILVSLIVLCIISLTALHSECLWYADLAGRTLYAAEQGDTDAALARFDTMQAHWEAFHDLTGLFVDGEKLDAIYERMVGLRPLLEQAHPEARSELTAIRKLIDGIYEEEMPRLPHIL